MTESAKKKDAYGGIDELTSFSDAVGVRLSHQEVAFLGGVVPLEAEVLNEKAELTAKKQLLFIHPAKGRTGGHYVVVEEVDLTAASRCPAEIAGALPAEQVLATYMRNNPQPNFELKNKSIMYRERELAVIDPGGNLVPGKDYTAAEEIKGQFINFLSNAGIDLTAFFPPVEI